MNNGRFVALAICASVIFVSTESLAQQQKTGGFVKIPIEDILTTKSLKTVVTADGGWVFGYDQVGYIKKMAIEDIPTITSFQEGVLLHKEALQEVAARDSGYVIGYDGYGNLVKLPISTIPDDTWRAFTDRSIGIGSGYVFAWKTTGPYVAQNFGLIKISIENIPASRSLDLVAGADEGYVIGFEKSWAGNDLRKMSIDLVPEVSVTHLSTVITADSGYAIGLDSRGSLIRISLSELELGYASSLENRIIDADSGFVICRVVV